VDVFVKMLHILNLKKRALMIYGPNWFCKTGQNGTQDSSATQVSSQTPLATIMSSSESGKIESGCFCSIV